ncbi:MAG: alpha-E domain-containing protein, partial [Verrucomicrobiota bacterium]
MLSRVAENLFWMSRYMERADNLARLFIVHQSDLLDATSVMAEESYDWHPLLAVTSTGDENSAEGVQTYMVSSKKNPDSVINCVYLARENARAVRDQISNELWVEINALWLDLKEISPTDPDKHEKICEMVNLSSLVFRGIVNSSLARTEAWAFVELGEYLERADK